MMLALLDVVDPLPEHWYRSADARGTTYYWHQLMRTTTYTRPEPLPLGWTMAKDAESEWGTSLGGGVANDMAPCHLLPTCSGLVYYWNFYTRETVACPLPQLSPKLSSDLEQTPGRIAAGRDPRPSPCVQLRLALSGGGVSCVLSVATRDGAAVDATENHPRVPPLGPVPSRRASLETPLPTSTQPAPARVRPPLPPLPPLMPPTSPPVALRRRMRLPPPRRAPSGEATPLPALRQSQLEALPHVFLLGWSCRAISMLRWAPAYFVLSGDATLLWYEADEARGHASGDATLCFDGSFDLRQIARLQREEPTSDHNFVFTVATAEAELRIDPGTRDEFHRWQDALLLAATLPATATPLPVPNSSDQ